MLSFFKSIVRLDSTTLRLRCCQGVRTLHRSNGFVNAEARRTKAMGHVKSGRD